ncbi:MAG: CDP-paratose 2-epimerase [Acidobacteria bacterium]|nr:MAG: CDP-paratose 2-epimerase [Acidobacteriota bacterium]
MFDRIYTLKAELWLPRPLEEVFNFFADPHNLEALTPALLRFEFLTPFPVLWQSEITVWEPPHRFVDRQNRGPYRLWIHEHLFEARDRGTNIRDSVRYAVPGGALVQKLLVSRDLEKIFSYRRRKLQEIFRLTIEE